VVDPYYKRAGRKEGRLVVICHTWICRNWICPTRICLARGASRERRLISWVSIRWTRRLSATSLSAASGDATGARTTAWRRALCDRQRGAPSSACRPPNASTRLSYGPRPGAVAAGEKPDNQPQHEPTCCAGSDDSPDEPLGMRHAVGCNANARFCSLHHAISAPAWSPVCPVRTMDAPVAASAVPYRVVLVFMPITKTITADTNTRCVAVARTMSVGVHRQTSCDYDHRTGCWFRSEMAGPDEVRG
jgi:hypothetical protein